MGTNYEIVRNKRHERRERPFPSASTTRHLGVEEQNIILWISEALLGPRNENQESERGAVDLEP